ncbi:hypothetical protein [Bacillus sp. AK031]
MMAEDFRFQFKVKSVIPMEDEIDSKEVIVHVKVKKGRKEICLEDTFLVRVTEVGIFPVPRMIAEKVESPELRRLLPFELKRYLKPQKRFLVPGDYE